jgi:hypothetical protein
MGGLAACTTIIGIDDSLPGPDDASVDAVAPGTDGGATGHGDATLPVDGGIVGDSATADVEVTHTITFISQQQAVAISPLGALVGSDLRFGEALALSSTGVLAIGAPGAGRADSDAGATGQVQLVTISLNADNSGMLSVELLNPGQGVTSAPVAGGAFGGAVAFSPDGHYLAVGAPAEPHAPSLTSGNVYLYQAQNGGWSYVGTFQPPPGAAPSFGRTVALTDNVLYIAATGDATEGDAGTSVARASVNAYSLVDGGFVPYRTATSPQLHDGFGWSLAVSLDNHFVAIGAPFGNVNDDSQDGLVYLAPLGTSGASRISRPPSCRPIRRTAVRGAPLSLATPSPPPSTSRRSTSALLGWRAQPVVTCASGTSTAAPMSSRRVRRTSRTRAPPPRGAASVCASLPARRPSWSAHPRPTPAPAGHGRCPAAARRNPPS